MKKLYDIYVAEVTPWSDLMERKRHTFDQLLTMILWILKTKLGSSKLSPVGCLNIKVFTIEIKKEECKHPKEPASFVMDTLEG